MKDKLGCRSHMFEGSFFSARCAYKKLSELCAGTPNRHILNQAPRQTRMVSWLSVYGAHYAPSVKSFEEQLQSKKSSHGICQILTLRKALRAWVSACLCS